MHGSAMNAAGNRPAPGSAGRVGGAGHRLTIGACRRTHRSVSQPTSLPLVDLCWLIPAPLQTLARCSPQGQRAFLLRPYGIARLLTF